MIYQSVKTPNFEWRFPPGTHYKCKHCGNCCRFPNVYLYPLDIAAINMAVSPELRDKFYDPETHRLNKIDGRCIFLMPRNGCMIYKARPLYCRAFPFKLVDPENHIIEPQEFDFCEGVCKGRIHRNELLKLDPHLKMLMDLETENIKVIRQPSN